MTPTTTKQTGVYQIKNLVNGKVYVGSAAKSFRSRWGVHTSQLRMNKHANKKLQNAWNKYGEESFVFEILLICAPKDCLFFEQQTIDKFDAVSSGYNLDPTAGSRLGSKQSEEAKAKIGASNKGRPCTDFQRRRLSETHKGKTISQEQKDAVSKTQKGRIVSEETKAKHAEAGRGRTHSEETKKKIGEASKNRKFTDEQRAKISAGVRRAYETTDLREKVVAGLNKRYEDPAAHAVQAEGTRKRYEDPEYRAKNAEQLKAVKPSKKGRSYEEMYGAERAAEMKASRRGPRGPYKVKNTVDNREV